MNRRSLISSARSWSDSLMAPTTLRSVERPARLRISARASTPPAAANSWPTTLASFRRRPCSMSRMTSGLVSLMVAMRMATSACSSGLSSASTRAARVECTLATTSAMVCGDSSLRKALTCSGGVRRRNSKGRVSGLVVTVPMISSARSAPTSCTSTSRAKSGPPMPPPSTSLLDRRSSTSRMTAALVSGRTRHRAAISADSDSTSRSPRCLRTLAARSAPRLMSRTAAFWRPLRLEALRSPGAGPPAVALGALAVERGLLAHSGSSLIQARSCWATRSGCSCTRLSTVERPPPLGCRRRPRRASAARSWCARARPAGAGPRSRSATSASAGPPARGGAGRGS